MEYRKEIDGLRAIAVLPVIFFHAGFEAFSGGFVGVDVFFVISGYLITSIILMELEQGQFSLVNFYERRARRILPALFVVMLSCIPFAYFWMLPSDMQGFSQSLVAVSIFASNVLFWRESGYFDTAAELKPLLHTWSLAVEEQYYLLFPLLLMLFWRFGKRWIFLILTVIGMASLAVAQWTSLAKPDAAFYLLPTRGWELLVGAFAAFYLSRARRPDFGRASNELGATFGLALIFYSIFSYSKATPFPGFYALAPTLGAFLTILFATRQTIVGKFLGKNILVGIGLISYSAYLWHQPLFAFARIRHIGDPSFALMLFLCGQALFLAYLSWRYVENPFRDREKLKRKSVFQLWVTGSIVFASIGVFFAYSPIIYLRYNARQIEILKSRDLSREYLKNSAYDRFRCFFDVSQEVNVLFENNCVSGTGTKRVVLFGDSEAAHYLEGFKQAASTSGRYTTMQFTGAKCRAIDYVGNSNRCKQFYEAFIEKVVPLLNSNDVVVVSSNWWKAHKTIADEAFQQALMNIVNEIHSSGAIVILVGNTPDFVKNPYELLLMNVGDEETYLPSFDYQASDSIVKKAAAALNTRYFAPTDFLCKGTSCRFKDANDFLFYDGGHLSRYGSEQVAGLIVQEFSDFD